MHQWPYTYDTCDIGTVANQTINNLPAAAQVNGDTGHDGILSFLPGQKLSRCTCPGEIHPGPKHSDGSFVGRAAPEIDMFEAQITGTPLVAQVSQSAQWAVSRFTLEAQDRRSLELVRFTAIQSRVPLEQHERERDYRGPVNLRTEHIHRQRDAAGDVGRDCYGPQLLRI